MSGKVHYLVVSPEERLIILMSLRRTIQEHKVKAHKFKSARTDHLAISAKVQALHDRLESP